MRSSAEYKRLSREAGPFSCVHKRHHCAARLRLAPCRQKNTGALLPRDSAPVLFSLSGGGRSSPLRVRPKSKLFPCKRRSVRAPRSPALDLECAGVDSLHLHNAPTVAYQSTIMRVEKFTEWITVGGPRRVYIFLHFTEGGLGAGIYSRSILGSAGFSGLQLVLLSGTAAVRFAGRILIS